jgi:hypothetical protein
MPADIGPLSVPLTPKSFSNGPTLYPSVGINPVRRDGFPLSWILCIGVAMEFIGHGLFAWKFATEALSPMAYSPVWGFIEHGGSNAAPLALALLGRAQRGAGLGTGRAA